MAHHNHDHHHHHSHAHDHDHDHAHDHDHHHDSNDHGQEHDHNHSHQHTQLSESPMNFEEKIQTLLSHWITHNNDHAKNYLNWSEKAQEAKMKEVAELLREASEMTTQISGLFENALKLSKTK